jgi:hypothetical protein
VVPSSWVNLALTVWTFDVDTSHLPRESEIWTWTGRRRRRTTTVGVSLAGDRDAVEDVDDMKGMMALVGFPARPDRLPWPTD